MTLQKVHVGRIPYNSSEGGIHSYFERCGTIFEIICMTFQFRGICKNRFKTEAAAKWTLALDGSDKGGFFLKIQLYKAAQTQIRCAIPLNKNQVQVKNQLQVLNQVHGEHDQDPLQVTNMN